MADKKLVIELELEKDTANTVRFKEIHDETAHPVIRQLYIGKAEHAGLGKPDKLRVTIEAI